MPGWRARYRGGPDAPERYPPCGSPLRGRALHDQDLDVHRHSTYSGQDPPAWPSNRRVQGEVRAGCQGPRTARPTEGQNANKQHSISKTPTANHRRALPSGKRLCGQMFGPSLANLSDYVFPQPLWNIFGGHFWENEGGDQERWEKEEEEEEKKEASWEPLGLLGPPRSFLEASWRPPGWAPFGPWGLPGGLFGRLRS